MYLQSLTLQGFKSFPDKIKLTFDKGITGVVGPNGSGKSNIGDAVRWVLGEQSSKTLRSGKMEDVIFAGTSSRHASGFALVTLEISGEVASVSEAEGERVSPLKGNQAESDAPLMASSDTDGKGDKDVGEIVTITRKLYRNGDSEYRINGKSVRLRDITELFMDTGLGKDGYAIIGQGRIAEIVSAKSTDRRDIFEEAAGVSKFRHKKADAERRLDAAEENLLRLTDILTELEGRLEPLRRAAEKAKQYIALYEEQKGLEISLWTARAQSLCEKVESISNDYLRAGAEYENVGREIERVEERVQDGYASMQETSVHIEATRSKVNMREEENATRGQTLAVCENDIVHCRERLASFDESRVAMNEEDESCKGRIEKLRTQIAEMQARCDEITINLSAVDEETKRLETDVWAHSEATQTTNETLQSLYRVESELKVMRESAHRECEDIKAQIAEESRVQETLRDEVETAGGRVREKEKVLETARTAKETFSSQLAGFQKKYESMSSSLVSAQKAATGAFLTLREATSRAQLLQDMERNMEGVYGSVKAVLRAQGGHPYGVHGTVAQLVTTSGEYSIALETALGSSLQHIVVENESVAKQWIRYLSEQRAGRATFLPLTAIKGKEMDVSMLADEEGFIGRADTLVSYDAQYTEIVRYLLGRIVVAEDLDTGATIAKKYNYRFRVVTLTGQVINAGGSFTGGSAQKSSGLLSRRAQLQQLREDITTLTAKKEEADKAYEMTKKTLATLEGQIAEMQSSVESAQTAYIQASAESEKEAYVLAQLNTRLDETKATVIRLQEAYSRAQANYGEIVEKATENDKAIATYKDELTHRSDKATALRAQLAELSEKRSDLQLKKLASEKDMASLCDEMTRYQTESTSRHSRLEALAEQIDTEKATIAAKEEEIARIRETLENVAATIAGDKAKIVQLQQVHDEQDRACREWQESLRGLNDAREKFGGEKSRLEERQNAVKADYDSVVRQLFDQYELTLSAAMEIAKPLGDVGKANRELQSIKGKIRALGSVNVAAIEEYKEVSERHKFLSEQVKDVQTSKRELIELITSLTAQMEQSFSESFAQINHHFGIIFRDLFGGGVGRLELTDPNNVLESGIEIKAAPPGKVIKNLISLSGGEQSFVAIAIYFAILRVHPAPFCILDEIDAALDEGNVRRFAQYLTNFTDTTQFILVTHRRSAMEQAGVLYGVTMQEDGISRILRMEQEEFGAIEGE